MVWENRTVGAVFMDTNSNHCSAGQGPGLGLYPESPTMGKTSGQDTQLRSGCASTDDRPSVRLRHCIARVKVSTLSSRLKLQPHGIGDDVA